MPSRPAEELRSKLSSGEKVDAGALIKGWGAKPVSSEGTRELKQAVLGNAQGLDGRSRAQLQRFVERSEARAPDRNAAHDPWADLQLKALGDGRISERDARAITQRWAARPVTAQEAQSITQAALASTGTFAGKEALGVVQKFLQNDLPRLTLEGGARDFGTELRVALMDDGHLDTRDVENLASRWKSQSFTPAQAKALSEAVLKTSASIDPGGARSRMQLFLEKELPALTGPNPDGSAARRDHSLDLRIRQLGDGKIDRREATELTRTWEDTTMTPAEGEAIRQAVLIADPRDRTTSSLLKTFVDHNIPRLILGQALTSPNNAKLTWTPPFANVDGSALTNLAGYTVKYGTQPGVWDRAMQVDDPSATGFTVENLTPGTWYFTVTARNTEGAESGPSNEASKTIQ
ncbi:MAG: fibronectin type III domain-containing protein [Myxococcaceae bacterium]|nr:fibronectin type III domain-containing protein [Myxococcaceae bacterium]